MLRYGDLPLSYANGEKSLVVLVSVPFDATSTWMKGSSRGPKAILEASRNMELYDTETGTEVYRRGIYTDDPLKVPASVEMMVNQVQKTVWEWLKRNKYVVTLGGEHSVSIGAVRAYHNKYPGMSVLQLDAHTDLRQEYQGSPFNHACTMARVREICPVTQVGIRSMDKEEIKYLSDQVYLTLDLDVLDPSIMSSTGTPEPGGMDWYTLLELIRLVCEKKELVGFDVVELCPSKHNRAPDFLAAKLIYKILSYHYKV
jgi:agmatinase